MNKKLTSSIAAGLLSAGFLGAEGGFSVPPLSLSSGLSFQTEDVERGHKWGQQVFMPNVRISVSPLEGCELYFQNKNWLGAKKSVYNRHDLTLGLSYDVTEIFTVDFGFTTRLWRNVRSHYDKAIQDFNGKVRTTRDMADPAAIRIGEPANEIAARKVLLQLENIRQATQQFTEAFGIHGLQQDLPFTAERRTHLDRITGAANIAALAAITDFPNVTGAGTAATAAQYVDRTLDLLLAANGTATGRLFGTEDLSSAKAMGIKRHGYEIYLGATANGLLDQPVDLSLYYTYGFTERRHNVEAKGNYLLDLSTFGVNGFSLDVGAGFGWDKKTRPWGMKKNVAQVLWNQGLKKSSVYWNIGTALVYDVTTNCAAKIGVEYQGLAKKKSWPYEKHRNHVWFTTSFDCHF